jgi:hypothetical protein
MLIDCSPLVFVTMNTFISTQTGWISYLKNKLTIYWVDSHDNRRISVASLEYGDEKTVW